MFKKLLKYDIKAIARHWWIGAVISVVAAIVSAGLIRLFMLALENKTQNTFVALISIFGLIVAFFCIIAIVLAFVFTIILVFVRFYKHFFTDEGYLTFTLPVKRSTLLLSKTVNAVIWLCAHFAVIVISLLLFTLLLPPFEESGFWINFTVFQTIGEWLVSAWSSVGAWLIVYILEALLIAFAYLLFLISLVHFCITVGSVLVKKAKLILSIGIYYAFSWCLSAIAQFGILLFGALLSAGMSILMENATKNQSYAIYACLVLSIAAALAAIAAVLYSATQHMLDRKLNLA